MGFKAYLLELVRSFKPFQTTVNISNLTIPISINGKEYNVKNGVLYVGDESNSKIPLTKDEKNFVKPFIKNTEMEGLTEEKAKIVRMLDNDRKIFTRSDIGLEQVELLNVRQEHESFIKKLKPVLQSHNQGKDMGSLLSALTIIRLEDEKTEQELCKKLHDRLLSAHGSRGSMIYNFFRTISVRNEIMNHFKKMKKIYPNFSDLRMNFLIYWDSIVERGYPTAYFVRFDDNQNSIHAQLKWRIEAGQRIVYVYSRTQGRNKFSEQWCRSIAKSEGWNCNKIKAVQLGFTPAVMLRISQRK